jgi:hypothetical protein
LQRDAINIRSLILGRELRHSLSTSQVRYESTQVVCDPRFVPGVSTATLYTKQFVKKIVLP